MTAAENAFKEMAAKRLIHGVMPTQDRIGRSLSYFNLRNIFLDNRGILKIHPSSEWGWFVTVITMSHNMEAGQITDGNHISGAVNRTVIVDECAWIGSNALLYNCHIKHHGAVACGAVVRNATVEPYTVVEGNPARAIKRFIDGHWVHIDEALAPFKG